jgi:bis(5'-nucleosyl)-tetraphosphatase (symmetrical)
MSTYLIGDIQGCLDPLERLLEKINFDPASDRLWPCGDLVNRGGNSLEVLRLLHSIAPRVSVTLGNHDLHLLADHARNRKKSRNREFKAIMKAHDRDQLIEWLTSQPLAAWSKKHRLLRVHAGVVPAWDRKTTLALSAEVSHVLNSGKREKFLRRMYGNRPNRWNKDLQGWRRLRLITNILTRTRFCDAKGRINLRINGPPGSQRKPYKPWFKHKHRRTRDVRVAFGHWAALGLKIKGRYLALDSGCVWGGRLSAYRLEDDRLFQVKGL